MILSSVHSFVFDMSPVYCPLLLVLVFCAVFVIGHLPVYSER